jgi:hypothetical protein
MLQYAEAGPGAAIPFFVSVRLDPNIFFLRIVGSGRKRKNIFWRLKNNTTLFETTPNNRHGKAQAM